MVHKKHTVFLIFTVIDSKILYIFGSDEAKYNIVYGTNKLILLSLGFYSLCIAENKKKIILYNNSFFFFFNFLTHYNNLLYANRIK